MRLIIHQPSTAKNIFLIPPLEATRLFRRPRRHGHVLTQRNPFVMNVTSLQTASDPDPFTINYYQWPIEHFDEAYMVSTTFSTSDPPLWSPLLTASARAKTLCSYSGQCLYCGGRDSSVRTCQNPFINSTGVLNPAWASSTMEATPSNNDNSVRSHTLSLIHI